MQPRFKQFKNVAIDCWRDDSEIKTIHNVLENLKTLKLDYDSGITDDQLLKIEAMNLHLLSLNITVDGAKKRLEHFLTHGKATNVLDLTFSIPENFQPISILPNNLKVQKLAGHEDHNNFYGKFFGRLDGIRQPWEIELKSFPGPMSIYCKIWRRSEKPCRLYPFYFGEE